MKRLFFATLAFLPFCANAYCIDAVQPEPGKWVVEYQKKMRLNGITYYCNRRGDCRTKEEWISCLDKMDLSKKKEPTYVYEKGNRENAKRNRTQEMNFP